MIARPERHELVGARRLARPVLGGVRGAEAEVASLTDLLGGDVLEAVVAGGRGAGGGAGGGSGRFGACHAEPA